MRCPSPSASGVARAPSLRAEGGAQAEAERGEAMLPYARVGAGFMIDFADHLVTAAHVVTDTDEVLVNWPTSACCATVVGADAELDVALLRIASPGRWRRRLGQQPPAPRPLGALGGRALRAEPFGGGRHRRRHRPPFSDDPELLYLRRPTSRSTPATPAGRWWMRAARSSA